MHKFKVQKFLFVAATALITTMAASSNAHAETMSCLIGVYDAKTLTDENADFAQGGAVVTLPIVDGVVSGEVDVRGEKVAVWMGKKEFADVYDVTFMLTTPVADRPARGSQVAAVSDSLYNDGPTKDTGFDLNPSPTAKRFSYLRHQNGTFGYSTKLVAAMKAAGVWKTQFSSALIDVGNLYETTEFVKTQLAAGKIQPTDIVGISTFLTCTRESRGTKTP